MERTPMWRRYLRFWGSDVRADVDAELDYHLRELTERLVHEGRGPAEARAEAERRFGDYARVHEACVDIDQEWERRQRWRQLLADLWQDLRIGVRTLAKNPGFTLSAVVVLGLGLGASTVVVSAINAVFIRPLPFPEPEQIVSVVEYGPSGSTRSHTQRAVAFLRDRSGTLSVVAGIGASPGVNLVSDRGATYVRNLEVTAGYFRVFGIEPRLGRTFSRDDETEPSTVVLSHAVWVGQFDADPGVVGEDVRLGGRPHTVIGVMPPDFWSFEEAGVWTPFRPDPRDVGRNYRLVGRLAPGSTAAQAEAELQALVVSLEAETPAVAGLPDAPRRDARIGVQPYRDQLAAGNGSTVWPLAAAVGVMLLIVCANAAGLQVARAVGRQRELAVRAALGGGPGRLLRQLLTESVLLATAGGAVGMLAAAGGVRGLVAMQPRLALWNVTVDAPVLIGSLAMAVATGVLFGLLPGLLAVRSEPADALHGESRSVTAARGSWMRRTLVVTQVALCTVLLVAAGGFLRTFVGLSASDLGFDPGNVLTARASLQGPAYQSRDAVSALYRRTLADLARVPGVEAAAVTNNLPVERGLNLVMRRVSENEIVPAGHRLALRRGRLPPGAAHPAGGRACVRRGRPPRRRAPGGPGQRDVPEAVRRWARADRHAPADDRHPGGRSGARSRRHSGGRPHPRRHRDPADGVRAGRTGPGRSACRGPRVPPGELGATDTRGRNRSHPVRRTGDQGRGPAVVDNGLSNDGRGRRRGVRGHALPHHIARPVRRRLPDAGRPLGSMGSSPTLWPGEPGRSAFASRWAPRASASWLASRCRALCSPRWDRR